MDLDGINHFRRTLIASLYIIASVTHKQAHENMNDGSTSSSYQDNLWKKQKSKKNSFLIFFFGGEACLGVMDVSVYDACNSFLDIVRRRHACTTTRMRAYSLITGRARVV